MVVIVIVAALVIVAETNGAVRLLIIIVMIVIVLLLSYNISTYSTAVAPKYNHNVIIIWSNTRVLLCDFAVEVSGFVLKGKK